MSRIGDCRRKIAEIREDIRAMREKQTVIDGYIRQIETQKDTLDGIDLSRAGEWIGVNEQNAVKAKNVCVFRMDGAKGECTRLRSAIDKMIREAESQIAELEAEIERIEEEERRAREREREREREQSQN